MRLLGVETVDALGPQHVCVPLHSLIRYIILTCLDQHPHGGAADLRRALWPRFFTTCFPGKTLSADIGILEKCRYHRLGKTCFFYFQYYIEGFLWGVFLPAIYHLLLIPVAGLYRSTSTRLYFGLNMAFYKLVVFAISHIDKSHLLTMDRNSGQGFPSISLSEARRNRNMRHVWMLIRLAQSFVLVFET